MRVSVWDSLAITVAICAHLSRVCHIVIFSYVKFANGAGRTSFQQPFVNAISVEEVHTGHRAQFFSRLVIDKTDHAFSLSFVLAFALGINAR